MDIKDLLQLAGLTKNAHPHSEDSLDHDSSETMRKIVVMIDPERLNKMEPESDCGCMEDEQVEEWANSGDHVSGEPEQMTTGHGELGAAVDTSLRRYLNAGGANVKVDETVYPDHSVEDISEAYAAFKEGKYKSDAQRKAIHAAKAEESVNEDREISAENFRGAKAAEAAMVSHIAAMHDADGYEEVHDQLAKMYQQAADMFYDEDPQAMEIYNKANQIEKENGLDESVDRRNELYRVTFTNEVGQKETTSAHFLDDAKKIAAKMRKKPTRSNVKVVKQHSGEEIPEASMNFPRKDVEQAYKIFSNAKKKDMLTSEAEAMVVDFAVNKLGYSDEDADMLAQRAIVKHIDAGPIRNTKVQEGEGSMVKKAMDTINKRIGSDYTSVEDMPEDLKDAVMRLADMYKKTNNNDLGEAAKPDFLDIDGDGDKEESMKKAAKDKEEKEVDESIDILKTLAGL